MQLRCKSSKRFLMNINIEEYHKSIQKMGIDITIPLRIEIPCGKCRLVEVYEIYPNTYKHIKSYKYIGGIVDK